MSLMEYFCFPRGRVLQEKCQFMVEAPKKMLTGGRGGCLKNVEGVVRGGMASLKKLSSG